MEIKATASAVVLLPLLAWCCNVHVEAQVPIPAKIDGFVYRGAPVWGHSVVVEAFFDPLCPDSRDSWPPLKQALHHYSDRLSVVVHPFALPYHSNAFIACRALHIANKLNASSTYPLLELFFKFQEKYYNQPTYNLSRASIIKDMARLAVAAIGKNSLSTFLSGFNDTRTDSATRISFKYGCSRGVTGTPFFFVNGMPLSQSGSELDYKEWRSIIDPLLEKQI
ncbi:DSBA-like thioredoxin domain containing protein [Musa troglodytarum]|uniref:DSBA-like thioredoxin domain containing protein n=1 Tax=Musa troglodytarum TaxID=320322 RepID=A0A9E7K2D8_9LILI|nr:DSBA-like thioredoxin domain containing protein [Musa troglodytarum]